MAENDRVNFSIIICSICLLDLASHCYANFHEDDFVPTSRRAQFHGSRTHWHDLLGRHCPRFGEFTMIALPIPEPQGWLAPDTYKMQLAFDGDRLVTPWLRIIGKGAPDPPMLQVSFRRTADSLEKVTAKVVQVPEGYLYSHHQLIDEFRNKTAWPKHLLVQYSWTATRTVDALSGLYVVFIICLASFVAMVLSVLVAYDSKVKAFMADLAGEDPLAAAGPPVKGD